MEPTESLPLYSTSGDSPLIIMEKGTLNNALHTVMQVLLEVEDLAKYFAEPFPESEDGLYVQVKRIFVMSYKQKAIHFCKLKKVLGPKFDFKTLSYSAIDVLKKGILTPLHKEMAHIEKHKSDDSACDHHAKKKGRGSAVSRFVGRFLSKTPAEAGGGEHEDDHQGDEPEIASEVEELEGESFISKGLAPTLKNTFVCSNGHEWVEDSHRFGI